MSVPKLARLTPQTSTVADEVVHISSFAIIKRDSADDTTSTGRRPRLLLARRTRPEFSAGKWTIPASIINYGEHPEAAMDRIVSSLLGTRARDIALLDIQSYGDKHWDLCLIYEAKISELGILSPDIEKVDYFDISNLPADLRDDHREILQALIDRHKL